MKRLTANAVAMSLAASPLRVKSGLIVFGFFLLPALSVSVASSTEAPIDSGNRNFHITADLELVGGVYINDHLKEGTAGRENQIKMTRALVGLGLKEGNWNSRLELMGIGDEIYQDPGDGAYLDIYRNL